MKWMRQGQWNTDRGVAECIEQEGFGIIGAWIDVTGEAEERLPLITAAPELLDGVREAWNTLRKLWAAQTEGDDLWPMVERLRLLLIQANPSEFSRVLACQGESGCQGEVTHIDNKGYTYCAAHGVERRSVRPCRKLLKREIATLERGETIWWDSSKSR